MPCLVKGNFIDGKIILRKILIVTDAWLPQVNGVVQTYRRLEEELTEMGVQTQFITPQLFKTIPCPTYPEIRLSLAGKKRIGRLIQAAQPDYIHIATEGPLGWAARGACLKAGWTFTTSYHTRFPEYIRARIPMPLALSYRLVRWFHNSSRAMLVATQSMLDELADNGFSHARLWTRGVDLDLFKPRTCRIFGTEKPVLLYVGRVAVEKNIAAFLELDIAGKKIVVGDGPARKQLEKTYEDVTFTGMLFGEDLAQAYASSDVFVFPSKTDTFGLVMLEAIACGTPVAAFPVTGPKDVLTPHLNGAMHENLAKAIVQALALDRDQCARSAEQYRWRRVAELFYEHISADWKGRDPKLAWPTH